MNSAGVLFRIEGIKAVKRRAFWVATGAFALFTAIPIDALAHSAHRVPELDFALPESWPTILTNVAMLGPFFVGMLMILLVAPEFTWRTGRQNVIDGLSKERLFTGKVMVLAGLVLLFVALPD